jgi:hypothetical protein
VLDVKKHSTWIGADLKVEMIRVFPGCQARCDPRRWFAEKKVPTIKGGRGVGKVDKVKEVGVGKRGSIIISKELVESLGIGAGDKFTLRKTKLGIALKKAE